MGAWVQPLISLRAARYGDKKVAAMLSQQNTNCSSTVRIPEDKVASSFNVTNVITLLSDVVY